MELYQMVGERHRLNNNIIIIKSMASVNVTRASPSIKWCLLSQIANLKLGSVPSPKLPIKWSSPDLLIKAAINKN